MSKQEASLRNWQFCGLIAYGDVYGHPRFPPGHCVHTSKIIALNKRAGIIETLHTFYRLEGYTLESEESPQICELERRLGESHPTVPKSTEPLRE